MTEIITRKEALARGLKRYFTGRPCNRMHIAEHYTVNGTCLHCLGNFDKGRWNPEATARRNAVVQVWNKKQPITMREVGNQFGLTRGAVGRMLFEARRRGEFVVAIDAVETQRRARQALQKSPPHRKPKPIVVTPERRAIEKAWWVK